MDIQTNRGLDVREKLREPKGSIVGSSIFRNLEADAARGAATFAASRRVLAVGQGRARLVQVNPYERWTHLMDLAWHPFGGLIGSTRTVTRLSKASNNAPEAAGDCTEKASSAIREQPVGCCRAQDSRIVGSGSYRRACASPPQILAAVRTHAQSSQEDAQESSE